MIYEQNQSQPPRHRRWAGTRSPAFAAAVLGALLLAAPPASHGQIYRWVDRSGITHFSQTPPPSGDYGEVQPPPPPAANPQQARDRINKLNQHFQDQMQADRQQARQDQQQRQDQAQQCQRAKRRLTALTIRPHVLVMSSDGHARRMTEPQRQADIKATKARIAKYCAP